MEVQTLIVSESELNELTTGHTITFTTSDGTTIPILNSNGTFTISDTNSQLSSLPFDELTKQSGQPDSRPTEVELPSDVDTTETAAITLNVTDMMVSSDTEVLKSAHEVHLVTSHNYIHQIDTSNILASAYGIACSEEQEVVRNDTEITEEDPQNADLQDNGAVMLEMTSTGSDVSTIAKENVSCPKDATETNGPIDYLITEDSQQSEGKTELNHSIDLDRPPNDDDNDGVTNTVVIDVSNPIHLCQNSLITVNGQKCVLQQNVETGQLIAYPIRETKKTNKRRGRPRRKVETEKPMTDQPDTVDEATVEEEPLEKGLVVTANEAGEIVKRSARKRKTNTHYFSEYEVGKLKIDESEEEENVVENAIDDDESVRKKRRKGPKKDSKRIATNTPIEKRGRGRPRCYGVKISSKSLETEPPQPTQAFLIQTVEGDTIMMQVPMSSIPPGVSVQNVAQSIADSLSVDKLDTSDEKSDQLLSLSLKPPSEESTEESLAPVISIPDDAAVVTSSDTTSLLSDLCDNATVTGDESTKVTTLQPNVESEEQTNENGTELLECHNNVQSTEELPENERLLSTTTKTADDVVTKAVTLAAIAEPELMETIFEDGSVVEETTVVNPMTVIPLPRDVMSFLIPDTEEPVKIGLRASEDDLEKLLCPKCGFQAFFPKQYQEHLIVHKNETQKCKCCTFLTLQDEELVRHYKECHPKNICDHCNHTAEYAYLVKRHKCRHNAVGSTCEICGKTYRDQYILKMHIRTIHMPIDVLFECSVCNRKFNRKAHLKRHLRTHDPNKKYMCQHCNYRGCERSDLTKHQLIHEAPKHTCEICGQTFRHVKNKDLHVKRHNGQRDYKCGVCDFFGYTFTDIRKHIERKHTDTKTIICDKCGQAFKTEQLLNEHRLSEQCDTFRLEENLQEPDSLNELAVETISDEQLVDENNQLTSVTATEDADGIDSITLTDESIATLNALGGFTSPILVSNEMGEQLSASHILETSDGQVTILDGFLDHEGNNHVAMVTTDGQMIQGVVIDKGELRRTWKVTN